MKILFSPSLVVIEDLLFTGFNALTLPFTNTYGISVISYFQGMDKLISWQM